jgi:group I intron endonuclease
MLSNFFKFIYIFSINFADALASFIIFYSVLLACDSQLLACDCQLFLSVIPFSISPIWLAIYNGILPCDMFFFSVSLDTIEAFNVSILFSSTVPIKIYLNADLDKERIILENKNKPGVYQFINLLTGNSYVGSSTNLSRRFAQYFNYNYISNPVNRRSVIYSSIIKNGYSNFSIIILEYSEIKDTISREQFYIDVIRPTMNILQRAGNSLGYNHTEETKTKMSIAKSGKNNPMFGIYKTGENNPMYGKTHSVQTLDKMSIAKGTAIYVYDTQGSLAYIFSSARKAAEHFGCSYPTILKFAKNGKLFQEEWLLSTS